jgi:hypothetical protein
LQGREVFELLTEFFIVLSRGDGDRGLRIKEDVEGGRKMRCGTRLRQEGIVHFILTTLVAGVNRWTQCIASNPGKWQGVL